MYIYIYTHTHTHTYACRLVELLKQHFIVGFAEVEIARWHAVGPLNPGFLITESSTHFYNLVHLKCLKLGDCSQALGFWKDCRAAGISSCNALLATCEVAMDWDEWVDGCGKLGSHWSRYLNLALWLQEVLNRCRDTKRQGGPATDSGQVRNCGQGFAGLVTCGHMVQSFVGVRSRGSQRHLAHSEP
ncbi:unnamed protein product [Symbiodinium microadriaticum]|nr:unnamed protein product [Symbiodinium microadriaticum]